MTSASNVVCQVSMASQRRSYSTPMNSRLVEFLCRITELKQQGRRREALARLRRCAFTEHDAVVEATRDLERLKIDQACVPAELEAETWKILLGNSLILGRAESDLDIPAPDISRAHLGISRGEDGYPIVTDLKSRYGTTLDGAAVESLVVRSRVGLVLGSSVNLSLWPHAAGLALQLVGQKYLAPLGPLRVRGHRLTVGEDEWLELRKGEAAVRLNGQPVERSAELLRGDELADSVGGSAFLRLL